MQNFFIKHGENERLKIVDSILHAAIQSVDPYLCTSRFIERQGEKLKIKDLCINLKDYKRILLIGTGKAVLPMALAVTDKLTDKEITGTLIAKHVNPEILNKLPEKVRVLQGSHPIPTSQSVESTRLMVSQLKNLNENDLVICLISGGGSSLMNLPQGNLKIEDVQEVNKNLLLSGAAIQEMNTVRKHLDQVKGGGLARIISPARLITFILSDVIGDSLDVIASGPTVFDPTTYEDALEILKKYKLTHEISKSVLEHFENGVKGHVTETVKPGEECLLNTDIFVVGNLAIATRAGKEMAEKSDLNVEILSTKIQGEAREVGEQLAGELVRLVKGDYHLKKPACLIAGGETTVTVRGEGKGGRNQETALSAARLISGLPNCLFISLATDGEDGITDAAGAVVDGMTIQKGIEQEMDAAEYLERNDSYHFLEKTGSLLKTGSTDTNVNDLIFMFAFKQE